MTRKPNDQTSPVKLAARETRYQERLQRDKKFIHDRTMAVLRAAGIKSSSDRRFKTQYAAASLREIAALEERRTKRREARLAAKQAADAAALAAERRAKRDAEAKKAEERRRHTAAEKKTAAEVADRAAVDRWIASGRTQKERENRAAYAKHWPSTALSMARGLEQKARR